MRFKVEYFLAIVFLFGVKIVTSIAMAQPPAGPPPGGTGTGNEPPCWNPSCVPVDGGLSLLLIGGAALGGKMLYDSKKKTK